MYSKIIIDTILRSNLTEEDVNCFYTYITMKGNTHHKIHLDIIRNTKICKKIYCGLTNVNNQIIELFLDCRYTSQNEPFLESHECFNFNTWIDLKTVLTHSNNKLLKLIIYAEKYELQILPTIRSALKSQNTKLTCLCLDKFNVKYPHELRDLFLGLLHPNNFIQELELTNLNTLYFEDFYIGLTDVLNDHHLCKITYLSLYGTPITNSMLTIDLIGSISQSKIIRLNIAKTQMDMRTINEVFGLIHNNSSQLKFLTIGEDQFDDFILNELVDRRTFNLNLLEITGYYTHLIPEMFMIIIDTIHKIRINTPLQISYPSFNLDYERKVLKKTKAIKNKQECLWILCSAFTCSTITSKSKFKKFPIDLTRKVGEFIA